MIAELLEEVHIAPSILSADFGRLEEQILEVVEAGARVIHVDVMDGHFVPNITIGPVVVKAIAPAVHERGAILDVHLMIENPDRYVEAFADGGRGRHHGASGGLRAPAPRADADPGGRREGRRGAQPGDAGRDAERGQALLRPGARHVGQPGLRRPVVHPDLHGQAAGHARLPADQVAIQVDGGVGAGNAAELVRAGANWLVAGNSVYGKGSAAENFEQLTAVVRNA